MVQFPSRVMALEVLSSPIAVFPVASKASEAWQSGLMRAPDKCLVVIHPRVQIPPPGKFVRNAKILPPETPRVSIGSVPAT